MYSRGGTTEYTYTVEASVETGAKEEADCRQK
jgi:uncharacterized protein YegJ (DUF2314 family)